MRRFVYGEFEYFDLVRIHSAYSLLDLKSILDTAQQSSNYFVGYVSYTDLCDIRVGNLASFAEFRRRRVFRYARGAGRTFYPSIVSDLCLKSYREKISKIKRLIRIGECYQINFTHNLRVFTRAAPRDIFLQLLESQDTPFRAFMQFDECSIISLSPELFFSFEGGEITVRPMKGTMARGRDDAEDIRLMELLQHDEKNISENLMILDLFRNDLHRVADSVEVKRCCEVETYATLFQMTSTIRARSDRSVFDVFCSLFPSGSVTGAPKRIVMYHIDMLESMSATRDYSFVPAFHELLYGLPPNTLESVAQYSQSDSGPCRNPGLASSRRVYCGALGVVSQGLCTFSIPIRTLVKYGGDDFYTYGVGSGIVWDSDYKDEYRELELKTSFLRNRLGRDFFVFETCLFERGRVFLKNLHLKRLFGALAHFRISSDRRAIKDSLDEISARLIASDCDGLRSAVSRVIRIKVLCDGSFDISTEPVSPALSSKVVFSQLDSRNDFLSFKTSRREHFGDATGRIQSGDIFDCIYYDADGKLLEGSRSNVVLMIQGELYTPRLERGAFLDGTYRRYLLSRGLLIEKDFYLDDIKSAQRMFCINSIRRFVEVHHG